MTQANMAYIALTLAIISEVIGTTFLAKSEQFTKAVPTAVMMIGFLGALYFLSQALKVIPLGVAYAIWAGLGIVLTSIMGLLVFHQKLDLPAVAGIAMIVCGVLVINLFSNAAGH